MAQTGIDTAGSLYVLALSMMGALTEIELRSADEVPENLSPVIFVMGDVTRDEALSPTGHTDVIQRKLDANPKLHRVFAQKIKDAESRHEVAWFTADEMVAPQQDRGKMQLQRLEEVLATHGYKLLPIGQRGPVELRVAGRADQHFGVTSTDRARR